MTNKYTFDDIFLIPQYSKILTRTKIDLVEEFGQYQFSAPIIPSPMSSVVGEEMYKKCSNLNIMTIVHRFQDIKSMIDHSKYQIIRAVSVGITPSWKSKVKYLYEHQINVFNLDTAHGDTKMVNDFVSYLRKNFDDAIIIAGNIVTTEAYQRLIDSGVDWVRIGVGNGAACSTSIATGHGYPLFSAINEIHNYRKEHHSEVRLIADGGMKTPGDVVKAIAAGADFVMSGFLFAGTQETPGDIQEINNALFKVYKGSASFDAKTEAGQKTNFIEGVSSLIPFKGSVKYKLKEIEDGLRSALSYSGVYNLQEFREIVKWGIQTSNGIIQNNPRI